MAALNMSGELDRILRDRAIRAVYQPIVALTGRRTLGYESLARGPEGSPLERPDQLFQAARDAGRLSELDWVCREAAIRGAFEGGLRPPLTLFANVEPEALSEPSPERIRPLIEEARNLRIVVEVTERAIAAHPAALLVAVDAIRERGWGVAVDDVGADDRSLALLPFIRPDVIKLDLRLVRDRPDSEIAGVVHSVNADAERTGAAILAEGIETEEQLATALSYGATLGQGWLLGRPGPLPANMASQVDPIRLLGVRRGALPPTPFEVVAGPRGTREGRRSVLDALCARIEQQALHLPDPPLVISSFQHVRRFGPAGRRYAALAARLPFVGVLAEGMPAEPVPGVRGAALPAGDPLHAIWSLQVVSPHFAAALVARELPDASGGDELFEFALTHDRDLVIAAAQILLARIVAR